jgi:tetratricopeptide (TPR) repeat protein
MPDTDSELDQAHDPTSRTGSAAGEDVELVPSAVGVLVLAGLLLLAALGGYALHGAVNTSAERRLAELDVIESGQGQVDKRPTDARARLDLAEVLRGSGRLNSALEEYDAVLERNPADVAALYSRGTLLFQLNRPTEAEASLWKVLAADEGHVRAAEALGDYYASKKQFRSLIEAVRPAVTAHPAEAHLQSLMGVAYENLGQPEWAAARYRLALDVVPDLSEALAGLKRLERSR